MILPRSQLLTIGVGVALLSVSAHIQIPWQPVPVTLQTLAVMVIGLYFSPKEALWSVSTYVALGLAGLPVLAGPFALTHLGYLIGFIAAVWAMGLWRERFRGNDFLSIGVATLLGTICVFGLGVGFLAVIIGPEDAVLLGLFPFIIPGLIKCVLLILVCGFLQRGSVINK